MTTWRIDVRDKLLQRVGELDDYQQLELQLKLNDVSTWRLTLNRRNRLAADLCADGAGIIVYRDGETFLSGYWTDQDHSRDKDSNTVTVSGVDDTGWLTRRLAHPVPADPTPPYSSQAADVRTQVATKAIREFVDWNASLHAVLARRVYGLTIGGDPLTGPTVTGSGRWQKLLELCQELAAAAEANGTPIAYRIIQSGDGLLFETVACEDKSATVRFSFELGNLASFSYKRTAPTINYAIVGGDGEGTARTYYEKPNSASVAAWGRIEDDLLDARNGDSSNEMSQAADEALVNGQASSSLSITPIDRPGQEFGVDYQLGDKVTVLLDSVGPLEEQEVADAEGQGTSVTTNYLIAWEAEALPFVNGTRVVIKNSALLIKDPGVRVVTGRTTAFGFTNIDFRPPALVSTVLGDHLVAIVPPQTQGDPIVDLVREVNIRLTPQDGARVTPSIGSAAKFNPSRVFSILRDVRSRLRNLERR